MVLLLLLRRRRRRPLLLLVVVLLLLLRRRRRRLVWVHLAQMKRLKWPADRVRITTPVLVACKAFAALAIATLTPGHPARRRSRRRRRAGRWLRHAKWLDSSPWPAIGVHGQNAL